MAAIYLLCRQHLDGLHATRQRVEEQLAGLLLAEHLSADGFHIAELCGTHLVGLYDVLAICKGNADIAGLAYTQSDVVLILFLLIGIGGLRNGYRVQVLMLM